MVPNNIIHIRTVILQEYYLSIQIRTNKLFLFYSYLNLTNLWYPWLFVFVIGLISLKCSTLFRDNRTFSRFFRENPEDTNYGKYTVTFILYLGAYDWSHLVSIDGAIPIFNKPILNMPYKVQELNHEDIQIKVFDFVIRLLTRKL